MAPHAPPSERELLSIAVGIATRGRPATLRETLEDLAGQTLEPAAILVAYVEAADIEDAALRFPGVRFLKTPQGSCIQRNRLLEAASTEFDLIFFMDDDFYLHRDYLRSMEAAFAAAPSVLGATGVVLADGAKGPGLAASEARALLASHSLSAAGPSTVSAFNTYGCNMIFRAEALARHGIRFDEQLPAYGWYEDIDFSRRLLPHGRLVQVRQALGVHLGVKLGRTSGKRLGYSQVVNPIYLCRKGTYPVANTVESISRHVLGNLFRSLAPEPYIDRRGRVRGNLLGLWDCARGLVRPDRILEM